MNDTDDVADFTELEELQETCDHEYFLEDETGNRLCIRCDHEWWEDPL